jgi:hypothetical protein
MSKFKEKRDSLELFVKEQLIGPGAYNKRFFFLEEWDDSEFSGKELKEVSALDNISEIIPEVPAYQYSTAILFPETREVKVASNLSENDELVENETLVGNDNQEQNTSADDEDFKEDTSESVVSKQQNYPNTLGLSFVIDKETDLQKDLVVSICFRKYDHILSENSISKRIGIWVSEYETEIESAIETYFSSVFLIERKDNNLFVCIESEINYDNIYEIDYSFLNRYLEENLIKALKESLKEKLSFLKEDKGISYFGIKGDHNLFFYSINPLKTYKNVDYPNVYFLFEDTLLQYIKNQLENDVSNYSFLKVMIKQVEIYNQIKDLVNDLKSVVQDKYSTPIWQSKFYEKYLILPKLDKSRTINRYSTRSFEDKDLKGLNYSVQYIIKDHLVYVKLVLINKNSIELKYDEPKQLNKKNEANKKAYFGIELKIRENKVDCLQRYNPPQLLDIDEEDSFNKLIYRNFIDYGEGYNTSVTWGTNKDLLKFISTDFLPMQETPKVDFQPSKIVEGKVINRILNDEVLSMKYISSLTMGRVEDEEILDHLSNFIDTYGGTNGWINEKAEELANEDLDDDSRKLLYKQLNACKKDYKRLIRNIELLRNDKKALAAFRVMNTAMFMQLHHSIKINEVKLFVPDSISEDYYKNIEIDYKWRSFQLAFILLNIDAFVRPNANDPTVDNVFGNGWPERNEIADLLWFPTGGGKTEAYLGIIAFAIAYRRFTKGDKGNGTVVLMRYTLRMLTLQQFQRATLLICAIEVIRKDEFNIPHDQALGEERITIGLFVGSGSLPNYWSKGDRSMIIELQKISDSIKADNKVSTSLPFNDCPWCGGNLFIDDELTNIKPNHTDEGNSYGINDQLNIACNSKGCTFHSKRSSNNRSLPLRLFDEDIYKFPPTLLFGTVDKFAAFANNVSTDTSKRNKDSRRIVGKGYGHDVIPPELIIQDEMHLLLGPLGSAVGLFEKGIDHLCTYIDPNSGMKLRPKIITSTATTRNTDKQIFALFNRRAEIFPKQGISCDDSFFAFYERNKNNVTKYESTRKYIGVLPIGKTQVWMQIRFAAITLAHRLKFLKEHYSIDDVFEQPDKLKEYEEVFDHYHTILNYFNSLKEVGKTQSHLSHYLPGDVNYVTKNTIPWSFMDRLIRKKGEIDYSELTGRLTGEEVKTNLSDIEKEWTLLSEKEGVTRLSCDNPPEYVIATNMISVGIDVSRFNTMIISSMPRSVAEYIQTSSRVARKNEGVVFTIHHPFRSRDLSHYQKFREFHEKFYSYVEPISVTPFASKALDRYLAMYAAVLIRHNDELGLRNNEDAVKLNSQKAEEIKRMIGNEIMGIHKNALRLDAYLKNRKAGMVSSVDGIISEEEVEDLNNKLDDLLKSWMERLQGTDSFPEFKFRNSQNESMNISLFINANDDNYPDHWKVSYSLREIGSSTVIKTVQQ